MVSTKFITREVAKTDHVDKRAIAGIDMDAIDTSIMVKVVMNNQARIMRYKHYLCLPFTALDTSDCRYLASMPFFCSVHLVTVPFVIGTIAVFFRANSPSLVIRSLAA